MSPAALADLNASTVEGTIAPVERKQTYSIASIPADGIGEEVVEAAIEVLHAIAKKSGRFSLDFTNYDWSSEVYKRTGSYVPPNHLDILRQHDAILYVLPSSFFSSFPPES
jgi:isocitrate/isopropylmalate dehydrogenase